MSYDLDSDPIIIDKSSFHKRWETMHGAPLSSTFIDKIEELKSMYPCFRIKSTYIQKNNGKNNRVKDNNEYTRINSSHDFPAIRNMRPRIGMLFTNTEGKARKNFISFMNKLSPQNKKAILPNFVRSLITDNLHIYIDQIITLFQIQPTYHDLYMEVLQEIINLSPDRTKELLHTNFEIFVNEEKYKIPNSILENLDNLDTSSDQLDQFCEYVQWKKKMKAIISFYIHCIASKHYSSSDDLQNLLIKIGEQVDINWNKPKILDIYLDIALHTIESLYKYYPKKMIYLFKSVIAYYYKWDKEKDDLIASSRFKILDITDIICKN